MTRWVGGDEETGIINMVLTGDSEPILAGHVFVESDVYGPDTHYFSAVPPGTVAVSARLDHADAAINRLSIVANGVDSATVTGLPIDVGGYDLLITAQDGSQTLIHQSYGDTDYVFQTATPGLYHIELARKYKGFAVAVLARAEVATGAIEIIDAVGSTWIVRTADISHTGDAAWTDIPGLSFEPEAHGIYDVEWFVLARTTNAADGPGIGVGLPATYDDQSFTLFGPSVSETTIAARFVGDPAQTTSLQSGSVTTAGKSYPYAGRGTLVAGASPSGQFTLRQRIDVAASTVTTKTGSWLRYRRLI